MVNWRKHRGRREEEEGWVKGKREIMRAHTHRIAHGAGHIDSGGFAQVNVHSLIRVKRSDPKEHNTFCLAKYKDSFLLLYRHYLLNLNYKLLYTYRYMYSTCMFTHVQYTEVHIQYTEVHIQYTEVHIHISKYIHVHTETATNTHIHTHIHTHTHKHTHTHIHTHTHTHTHIHTHTHTRSLLRE